MRSKEKQKGMIGFYGGTFDPIHFGHLNLAIEIMEAHHLDEVWFCPARINPHRLNEHPTPVEHRLKMLELVVKKVPQFRLLDIETKREGPSYTVDTLRQLIAKEKKSGSPRQICLILGDDALPTFFRWKEPEEIVKLAPLLIGSRGVNQLATLQGNPDVQSAIKKGLTKTKVLEISATTIRERLKMDLFCGHLVPSEVLDYIYANHLYLTGRKKRIR